jgi:hypothetical protein
MKIILKITKRAVRFGLSRGLAGDAVTPLLVFLFYFIFSFKRKSKRKENKRKGNSLVEKLMRINSVFY